MFRSSTILRELAQSLVEVIFLLKHSVKLRRFIEQGIIISSTGKEMKTINWEQVFLCIVD